MNGGWWLHFNSKTQHCVSIIHQDQLNMTHVMDNEVSTWPLRALLQHYVLEKHDAVIKWHYIKSWQDQTCALLPWQQQRLRNHAVNCNEQTENFKQKAHDTSSSGPRRSRFLDRPHCHEQRHQKYEPISKVKCLFWCKNLCDSSSSSINIKIWRIIVIKH